MKDNDKITLWVIDVDGTMTDGGIYYDENGNELKKFSTKDAAAFFILHELGIKIMVLTGRKCVATERRMKELNVDYFFQEIKDKRDFLEEFLLDKEWKFENIAYIGDDLNDLKVMDLCAYKACPADSCSEIKSIAHYISRVKGGSGAVRDIIEYRLKELGMWDEVVEKLYINIVR